MHAIKIKRLSGFQEGLDRSQKMIIRSLLKTQKIIVEHQDDTAEAQKHSPNSA